MATNTTATTQNHNGTGSQNNFAISFSFLANTEVDVKVGGVLKTLGTHYNIVGSQVQFTSGNTPPSGTANIVFTRDTDISAKKVDFADGSVLTETDLDNNSDQILFAQQEFTNDFVKRDGSNSVTGNLVFEGATDNDNETTLAITDPTADRTITIPDVTGTVVTTGDTGTVAHTMLANDAVDGDNIADDSINSEHYADVSIDTQHIANENITTAKLAPDAVTSAKLADNSVNSEHYVDGSIDHVHLANDIIDGDNIQDDVINSEHYVAGSIDHEHLANDIIDGDNIQNDVINSEHYVAGSIDHEHLANDIIDGDNVQDNAINNEHIAANAVRVNEIKDGEITSAKLNPSTVITASEQASATTNDTSFLTSAAADARFFNISTGDTIKDGDTFPDNDTTIATTAAINDRIIDLIDDVGGFTIIASEQAFPNVNPQGTTGQAAVLSIKAATTNLVPSGTTVTITNGNVADNADITITGVPSTIPSGFGFLVESTTTLHTYTFHRLVPKATEVTTVAGKAVEIGRLGTADAVADMAILGTADVVADMNTLATADVVSDMNTLATADIVSDMNTLAVADVISDMDTVATNVTNVNNVGNNITNVNSVSNSAGANQTFTVTVQNVSGNKYFIDGVQTPVLKLARGKTYTFDMSDSSNSGHPLAFRDSSDNSYTTGVTTSGTAGSSGATVVIVVAANAPSSLKYYCTSHGNAMGNTISVIDDNVGIVAGDITNVNNVGGSIANVNSVGSSISNVNTVASNINSVNSFFNTYRIGANNPTDSLDVGDLFFNTTSDSLKVYTGSAWVDGVTATGNFATVTGNTFTGSNNHNDNVKSIYGTGSDLEMFHTGNHGVVDNITGALFLKTGHATSGITLQNRNGNETMAQFLPNDGAYLYYDNNIKFKTISTGVNVTGNITVSGNVDGRDVAADGTKLDGIESGATADQSASEIVALVADQTIAPSTIDMEDDERIKLGASDDLQLYHGANQSVIFDNYGDLRLCSDNVRIRNGANSSTSLYIDHDGATLLYHNGSQKFETLSTGANITGNLGFNTTSPTSLIDARATTGATIQCSNTSSNIGKIGINVGSAENFLFSKGASATDKRQLTFMLGTSTAAKINTNLHFIPASDSTHDLGLTGTRWRNVYADTLYGDGSNLTGINTDLVSDTSPQLGGTLESNGNEIHMDDGNQIEFGTGNDLKIFHASDINIIESHNDRNLEIKAYTNGASETQAKFIPNGAVEVYYNNSKKLETTNDGIDVDGSITCNDLVTAGAVLHENDTNTLVHFDSADNIALKTGGITRLRIHNTLVRMYRNTVPDLNNTYDLGSSSLRWRNIYTNDLNLSNEGGSNDVDGTWGSYTIQEGAEDLFLVNKRNGKKYKFNLTEVS